MADINKNLAKAVVTGNISDVKVLLNKNADPNFMHTASTHIGCRSILDVGVRKGNVDIVRILLQHGGNPNVEDDKKSTPIFSTVFLKENSSELARLLLQYGADVHHAILSGITALGYLIEFRVLPYPELRQLIDGISNIEQVRPSGSGNLLHSLSSVHIDEENEKFHENQHYCEDFISLLCGKGISVNTKDDDGDTPLHQAVSVACIQSIQAIVSKGADVNAKNHKGQTPLFMLKENTWRYGFLDSLQFLVRSGADMNAVDVEGKSVLHYVVAGNLVDPVAIEQFLGYGANAHLVDRLERNLLHSFVLGEANTQDMPDEAGECVAILTEAGVDVNGVDVSSRAPLHIAVFRKDIHLIEALVKSGASMNQTTKTGETSFHRATARPFLWAYCFGMFGKEGTDINAQDGFGSTALHWAVWLSEKTSVEGLLCYNVNKNIKDSDGKTPLQLAKILQYRHLVLCLEGKQSEISPSSKESNEVDVFKPCKKLKNIDRQDGKFAIESWVQHLQHHNVSLNTYVRIVLESTRMGLYFDLDENDMILDILFKLMKHLSDYVAKSDPLLTTEIRLAGSRYEGTKFGDSNEFDFLWTLTAFSGAFIPVESDDCPSEYVKLRLRKGEDRDKFSKYIDADGFLEGRKVNRALYSIVNEGLLMLFKENKEKYLKSLYIEYILDSTDGGLSSLVFDWIGPVMKNVNISVDVVPEIVTENWVPTVLQRQSAILQRIKNKGRTSVVLKSANVVEVPNSQVCFRISFASWEQAIIRSFPTAVKKGYIVIKALLGSHYMPSFIDKDDEYPIEDTLLTSYKLKTCFLHELERACLAGDQSLEIEDSGIKVDVSLDWANRILNHLESAVEEGSLPSFFDPGRNLLIYEGSDIRYVRPNYSRILTCLKELLKTATLPELIYSRK